MTSDIVKRRLLLASLRLSPRSVSIFRSLGIKTAFLDLIMFAFAYEYAKYVAICKHQVRFDV